MKPAIDLRNLAAETAAARTRTGRDVDAIVADLAAADFYIGDLNRAVSTMNTQAETDKRQTEAALARLTVSAHPQALQVAGLVIRRADPEGEAKRLHEGFTARCQARIEAMQRHRATSVEVDQLRQALYGEAERAGLTVADANALLRQCTVTRT